MKHSILLLSILLPTLAFCQIDTVKSNAGPAKSPLGARSPEVGDSIPSPAVATNSLRYFIGFFPINTDPYFGYRTPMYKSEPILFEASPEVRISIYNNIFKGLSSHKKHTHAEYIHFRTVLRMYNENSNPVKTASTPILLGTQQLWTFADAADKTKFRLWALSFETGHYSNGQSGGAFSEVYADGSKESEAIYNTIAPESNLSAMLNRKNGNFSTNLTELKGNVRLVKTDANSLMKRTHSFTLGATLYHNLMLGLINLGGYTKNDIAIYGRWQTHYAYEYINTYKGVRYALSEQLEVIHGAHPWVEPLRFDTKFTVYPIKNVADLGLAFNWIWGHDNYNYRFVDHGHQFGISLTWSVFPPINLEKPYR